MFNACEHCGVQPNRPTVDERGAVVCPHCGHRESFRRLPLLLVGGPAGAGKSTAGAALLGRVTEAVVFETDLLWRREFNTPSDGYLEYFSLWLRLSAHSASNPDARLAHASASSRKPRYGSGARKGAESGRRRMRLKT